MSQSAYSPIKLRQASFAVPAGLLIASLLLVLGGNLAGNGVLGLGAEASVGMALPGWEQGSLLRVLAVWIASWFSFALDADTALVLVYVMLASGGAMLAYEGLRKSDWPVVQAMLALLLVAGHGVLLYSVTTASHEFLLLFAAAALIPAARRLEAVGDVQSILNYGLTLTVLLLAGPQLAVLIPLLVLAVPFREPEARRKISVFGAMLLVAVIPALIIVAGVWAMAAKSGLDTAVLAQPFAEAFERSSGSVTRPLLLLAMTAPVGLVMLVHILVPDRRRKVVTSLLALILPAYVLVGNAMFAWNLAPWTPGAIMLATSLGWLCSTRLRAWTRWVALGLLAVGSLGSWALAASWADAPWMSGLMPLRLFGYSWVLPGL